MFDFLYIKRCVEKKKILVRHNKVAKQLLHSTFVKNTEAAIGGAEAVTGGVLQEKVFIKDSQTSQENTCVGVFFLEVASLQS